MQQTLICFLTLVPAVVCGSLVTGGEFAQATRPDPRMLK